MILEIAGIDGAGKSTLTSWIARTWGFSPRKVQPYDELFWEDAARIGHSLGLRAVEVIKAGAIARALLVEMSRLDKGRIVFDRFLEGARMYWAVKDLQPIPEIVLSELRGPDHVILLDIDPKIAIVRRNHPSERTRDEELTYLQKCATYLRNKAVEDQWKVVDASLPLEIVESEINQLLTQLEGSRV